MFVVMLFYFKNFKLVLVIVFKDSSGKRECFEYVIMWKLINNGIV